jgi:hypothetical protein
MRCTTLFLIAFSAAACTRNSSQEPINSLANVVTIDTPAQFPTGPLSPACHSAYWPCVPETIDVDCLGKGNGPTFIIGPVDIVTSDPYDLDDDGDGIGCER